MKRRYSPFLTERLLGPSGVVASPRSLASRQTATDRAAIRRPGPDGRNGAVRRIVPTAGFGILSVWLGLALLGGPTHAAPAAAVAPSMALVESVVVDGEGIFLDQIVTTTPATPLPHIWLAPPPTAGQVTQLNRSQVLAWIQTLAPAVASTHWSGPDQAKVTRRTRSLDETEIREMLTSILQQDHVKDRGELELRLTRAWPTIAVADGPLSVKVLDLPASGVSANFIVRFELWAEKERLGAWQLVATAKIWRDVIVAGETLKRGQLLSDANLSKERRDVLTLRDAGIGAMIEGEGELELKENVAAGQPVLARSLRLRPVVRRGSVVDGLIFDGPMTITLKVEVLEDGLPGNVVRVRNPQTRREMLGKVKNEQTILIPM